MTTTYRQYKQDTDSVASWLASPAMGYGYSKTPDILSTSPLEGQNAELGTNIVHSGGRQSHQSHPAARLCRGPRNGRT